MSWPRALGWALVEGDNMATIIITTDDREDTITTVGEFAAEDALRAHGYDPGAVDYSVQS